MDKVYQLLAEIKKVPGAFLGRPSLERLSFLIEGYRYALMQENPHDTNDCLDGFTEYVAKHYKMHTSHGWCSLIQFFNSDDQSAFETFYELLDKHIKSKKRKEARQRNQTYCLTYEEFMQLIQRKENMNHEFRWLRYMEVMKRIHQIKPDKVLEMNPLLLTAARNSDILCESVHESIGVRSDLATKVITHNPTQIPWPIEDKSYDLFICLQGFECLTNKQAEVFQEIKRISKHAMIGFPEQRYCPMYSDLCPERNAVDSETILKWAGNEQYAEGFSGAGDRNDRFVYLWKFVQD